MLTSPAVPSFKDSKSSCVELFAPVQTSGSSTSGALIKYVTFISSEKKSVLARKVLNITGYVIATVRFISLT